MKNIVPEISIIIPSFRSEPTIKRTINSVIDQKLISCQIIIVEDGVLDNTSVILANFPAIEHIQLKVNQGACHARNIGMQAARSDYVMFLDADDYLDGELFLRNMLDTIQANQTSLVLGKCKKLWESSGKVRQFTPPENETREQLLFRWLCGHSGPAPCSIIWKKSEVERIGGWNENYSKNQDGELMIRAMLNGCSLSQSYIGTGVYVQHDGERVSARSDDKAFNCLRQLETYIGSNLPEEMQSTLQPALITYQLQVGLRALNFNRPDIAEDWLTKWSESRSKLGLRAFKQLGAKYAILNLLCLFLRPSRFVRIRKFLTG